MDDQLIYVCANVGDHCEWHTIDYRLHEHQKHPHMNTNFNTPLYAGCTAFDSNIYVIGGEDDRKGLLSNLSIFNTITNTWSDGPSMSAKRKHPLVFPTFNRVYVFGGMEDSLSNHWAEYYNISENKWFPLSKPPIEIIIKGDNMLGKIVLHGGKTFMMWGEDVFCFYDVHCDKWYSHFLRRFIPGDFKCASTNGVCLDNAIYWYYGGDVLAFNMEEDESFVDCGVLRTMSRPTQDTSFLISKDSFLVQIWLNESNTMWKSISWAMLPPTLHRFITNLETSGKFVIKCVNISHCVAMETNETYKEFMSIADEDDPSPSNVINPRHFLKTFSEAMYAKNYLSFLGNVKNGGGRVPVDIPISGEPNLEDDMRLDNLLSQICPNEVTASILKRLTNKKSLRSFTKGDLKTLNIPESCNEILNKWLTSMASISDTESDSDGSIGSPAPKRRRT